MRKIFMFLIVLVLLSGLAVPASAKDMDLLPGIQVHGYISQGFIKSTKYNFLLNDSEKGSFQYNEMGLNFTKRLTDKLRIGIQFFARDVGDAANDKITVNWAYGDYRFRDWLGIRIGKIKLPMGLFNEIRDMDMLRACIVLPQSIYTELSRDTVAAMEGVGLYGTISLQKAGDLEYQLLSGIIKLDKDSGFGKLFSAKTNGALIMNDDSNSDTSFAGSLLWNTPLAGLAFRATALKTDYDVSVTYYSTVQTRQTQTRAMIYSAEYLWNNLTLTGELMTGDSYTSYTVYHAGQKSSVRTLGYYLMGSWRFNNWLEAGAYYSELYPNASDKHGSNYVAQGRPDYLAWQKDAALFARFDINDNFIVKIEGHHVNGVAAVLPGDNASINEKDWYYGVVKATFSF